MRYIVNFCRIWIVVLAVLIIPVGAITLLALAYYFGGVFGPLALVTITAAAIETAIQYQDVY